MATRKATGKDGDGPIIIKKYANRRLYNTTTSKYVTLDLLAQMVKEDVDFVVQDAKTGEDITRAVLTQIIVEEESKEGQNLLPIGFLRQIIGFYGDQMGSLVPQYLEHTMQSFALNQEKYRRMLEDTFGDFFPMQQLEDMSKQNMAFFENAMKMFNPLEKGGAEADKSAGTGKSGEAPKAPGVAEFDLLRTQLTEMQKQLDKLYGRG